ncbi:MAG: FAD-dependent oxidoreductase, partial [Candidatus Promineifilaceae bacterium]
MTHLNINPHDALNEEWLSQAAPSDWKNPTPNGRYNLLVIGGGSAGLLAAVGANGVGAKVALVEKTVLGGDCLNVGCVPSKTIIRSAKVIGDLRHAKELGIHIPDGVSADFGAVMQRMRQVRANISHHDSAYRFQNLGIDTFFGSGKFTSAHTFEIDGQTIEFQKAVIATGSRPAVIPIPGLDKAGFLTNESVFYSLTELPPRLAVIGGGPIGSELAQTFQRLGSEVTMFEVSSQILSREDPDAAAIVQASLAEDGIQFQFNASIKEVITDGDSKIISFESNGQMQTLAVDN